MHVLEIPRQITRSGVSLFLNSFEISFLKKSLRDSAINDNISTYNIILLSLEFWRAFCLT